MNHPSLAVCVLLALTGVSRADLISPSPDHDAGPVRGGIAVVHRFELVNEGREVIEVGQPRAGCGCLRPTVAKSSLRPGERTVCSVEINTVTQPAGDNTWRVLVPYRQVSQQGEVLLQVKAKLTPELTITPASLVLHTETALAHDLKLIERRSTPLTIRSGTTTSPHVTVRGAGAVKEGETWARTITLDVARAHPEGRHEHVLHLYTGDESYPELKVAFTVVKRAAGGVQASPAEVEWRGGETMSAKLLFLSCGDGEGVEVERVEVGHPSLTCTFASGPGPRATLRIVCERTPAGGLDSSVKVHLSKPAGKVVTVPVRILP